MAVTKIELIQWEGREDIESIEYVLTYVVWTNSRNDGPLTVRQAMGLHYGDVYLSGTETDILARCSHISERQLSSGDFNHWEVQVTYSQHEKQENPLAEPIKETVTWDAVTRKTDRWANGNPILNTAYDPVLGGIEYDDNTPTVTYTLNQANFPFVLAQAVRNAINLYAWKGFAPYTVKIASMTSERMFDKRIGIYYAVSYTFAINPDTFITAFESMGFNQLVTRPGTGGLIVDKKPILTGGTTGLWIKDPVGLRPDGRVLNVDTATQAPIPTTTDPTNYIAVVTGSLYPELDFSALFPFL